MKKIYCCNLVVLMLSTNLFCNIVTFSPYDLITPQRFDIMAKYIFAKHYLMNVQSSWADELYAAHLEVWNGFNEYIPPAWIPNKDCAKEYIEKHGFQDYKNSFIALIEQLKKDGFDADKSVIPIDNQHILMDGGHRTAAALALDFSLPCKVFNSYDGQNASSEFFKNHRFFIKTGLTEEYLDAMALEYARLKQNTFMICLFPTALSHQSKVVEILKRYGSFVYIKNIPLTERGAHNLMHVLYEGEAWLGSYQNNFHGAKEKKNLCFSNTNYMLVILYQCKDLETTKRVKKEIRDLCNVGNHSVHINDTHEQTCRLAETFFCNNSIMWLNSARKKEMPRFNAFLQQYKQWLAQAQLNPECFCIDCGGVLAAFGLRDCTDLDFLCHDTFMCGPITAINNHADQLQYHAYDADDIIFNPRNHFYYKGIKFAAPHVVKKMKERRGESKDMHDVALLMGLEKEA